jgi:PRC-barrel domain
LADDFTLRYRPQCARARNETGENLGRIVDVLIDQDRQVRAVVIDFGGFLGVGARRLVVDWTALHFGPNAITADITRDQASTAPEYKPGKPIFILGGTRPTVTPQM